MQSLSASWSTLAHRFTRGCARSQAARTPMPTPLLLLQRNSGRVTSAPTSTRRGGRDEGQRGQHDTASGGVIARSSQQRARAGSVLMRYVSCVLTNTATIRRIQSDDQKVNKFVVSHGCELQKSKKNRGIGRIELPTSRTLSENHTTRPNPRRKKQIKAAVKKFVLSSPTLRPSDAGFRDLVDHD